MTSKLLSLDEASKILSIGKTKLYSEINLGRIKAVKIDKRTFIRSEDIDEYISNLTPYPSEVKN